MGDEKRSIFGILDVASRTMFDIVPLFDEKWKQGHTRMVPEEVKRAEDYLKKINKASREIKSTLNKFKNLNQ